MATDARNYPDFDPGKYQGKDRLLLIFSTEGSDFTLSSQFKSYSEHESGYRERDLKIFHISDMDIPDEFGEQIHPSQYSSLKKRYGIPEDEFAIILIGKDGTEKLRTNDVLPANQLFSVIDALG